MARWVPTLTIMLVSIISYIDRATLALLSPTILRETHMSGQEYGWIISGFSIIYLFANPLWGRWLDRIGLRSGMLLAVGSWTLASAAHALASGFGSFALARAALGFGEGATFPGCMRTVVQSLPAHEQSRGIGIAYSGASAGAIITPLLITPIAFWFGWRGAFLSTGIIGVAWLVLWSVVSRRKELAHTTPSAAAAQQKLSFRDRRVWAFMIINGLGMVPSIFVLYNAANYLHQVFGKSQAFIGAVLWIPFLGWEAGNLFFGFFVDWMKGSGLPGPVAVRRAMGTAAVLAIALAAVPWTESVELVLAELAAGMFLAAGLAIPSLTYASFTFPQRSSAFVAGLASAALGAASTISMPMFGKLFDLKRYDIAFLAAAACPITGYVLWLWLTAEPEAATSTAAAESA